MSTWRAALALLILCMLAHTPAIAGEPTAAELLERTREGRSILEPDSLEPDSIERSPGPGVFLGIGVNRIAIVPEITVYPSAESRNGGYLGIGFGSWFGEFEGIETVCVHAGFATRLSDVWHAGFGLESNHATVRLYWGSNSSSASASFLGPHCWIEGGSRKGLALRLQLSMSAPGVSLHWRD